MKKIFDLYCSRLDRSYGYGPITAGLIFLSIKESEIRKLLDKAWQYYRFAKLERGRRQYPFSGESNIIGEEIDKVFPNFAVTNFRMNKTIAKDLRNWLVEPVPGKLALRIS